MPKTFLVSDTHWRHKNIIKFEPHHFPQKTIEERDEAQIELWNATVSPKDEVIHLGDVAFNTGLEIMKRLNGRFTLLLCGNHEHKNIHEYLEYFDDAKASCVRKSPYGSFVMSHIPFHPLTLGRWNWNVHGHLHDHLIPDSRYINISWEQTELRPIQLEEVYEIMANRLPEIEKGNYESVDNENNIY